MREAGIFSKALLAKDERGSRESLPEHEPESWSTLASAPELPIERGIAGPGLRANVLVRLGSMQDGLLHNSMQPEGFLHDIDHEIAERGDLAGERPCRRAEHDEPTDIHTHRGQDAHEVSTRHVRLRDERGQRRDPTS